MILSAVTISRVRSSMFLSIPFSSTSDFHFDFRRKTKVLAHRMRHEVTLSTWSTVIDQAIQQNNSRCSLTLRNEGKSSVVLLH